MNITLPIVLPMFKASFLKKVTHFAPPWGESSN